MYDQHGSLRACLALPVTVGCYLNARFGLKQTGLHRIFTQVDAAGPEARHNRLPVSTVKKRVEEVGATQRVQSFDMRNSVRWHGVERLKQKLKSKLNARVTVSNHRALIPAFVRFTQDVLSKVDVHTTDRVRPSPTLSVAQ